jgi:hypothetical protein
MIPLYGVSDFIADMQRVKPGIRLYGRDLTGLERLNFDPDNGTITTFASPKYVSC